jgi:TonB-dependent SusC/RagA subfamily outer membrane receptor
MSGRRFGGRFLKRLIGRAANVRSPPASGKQIITPADPLLRCRTKASNLQRGAQRVPHPSLAEVPVRRPHARHPFRAVAVALFAAAGCAIPPAVDPSPVLLDSTVTAYGSQATRDVTTAVVGVDGDAARRTSPTTLADMIDGRFAGVEVRRLAAGGLSIRIRGQRSLRAGDEPLYVIDGIPQHPGIPGVLSDLDPRDISRIEVLKDAGATAAYGARGANGVILIITRRQ